MRNGYYLIFVLSVLLLFEWRVLESSPDLKALVRILINTGLIFSIHYLFRRANPVRKWGFLAMIFVPGLFYLIPGMLYGHSVLTLLLNFLLFSLPGLFLTLVSKVFKVNILSIPSPMHKDNI